MTAVRTPDEVLARHLQAAGVEDIESIVSDYTDDAILIVQNKVFRGKDGARAVFTQLLREVPQANWALDTTVFADDVLYLEWTARSAISHIEDGIDTFVFENGQIRAQTVRYTLAKN